MKGKKILLIVLIFLQIFFLLGYGVYSKYIENRTDDNNLVVANPIVYASVLATPVTITDDSEYIVKNRFNQCFTVRNYDISGNINTAKLSYYIEIIPSGVSLDDIKVTITNQNSEEIEVVNGVTEPIILKTGERQFDIYSLKVQYIGELSDEDVTGSISIKVHTTQDRPVEV